MSFVQFRELPAADPIGGYVLHCKDFVFGVKRMTLPADVDSEAQCPVTLTPLKELDKIGALVWAQKNKEEKSLEWNYICLPEDYDPSKVKGGKIHLFDYDSIKGFVDSEKDLLKCPLCKRGSKLKAVVSQIDVSLTKDLLDKRNELLRGTADIPMALYYEQQIARQIVINNELQFKDTLASFAKGFPSSALFESLVPPMELAIEKDRVILFKEMVQARPEILDEKHLVDFVERACHFESVSILEDLLAYKPGITTKCFEYAIDRGNEYLVDLLLDYYVEWTKLAKPEQLLRSSDWLELGKFAVIKRRFPHFPRAVQEKDVYRLLFYLRTDPSIPEDLLFELGLKVADDVGSPLSDDWGDEGAEEPAADDWDGGADGTIEEPEW